MSRASFILCCLVALVFLFGWDTSASLNASFNTAAVADSSFFAPLDTSSDASSEESKPLAFAPVIVPMLLPPASDWPATPAGASERDNALVAAPADTPLRTPMMDAAPANAPTRVEQAHAQLEAQGQHFSLVIVSSASQGLELDIYHDLRARHYRSTAGPDEGFDTHGQSCFPNCVYIPFEEVNALAVSTWVRVLRHELRHMNQAAHNPMLARDFREANGIFTSYGMFSEVCADYSINVGALYRAAYRMGALRAWLGRGRYALIGNACAGDKPSYGSVVTLYNRVRRSSRAFALLFPRYR